MEAVPTLKPARTLRCEEARSGVQARGDSKRTWPKFSILRDQYESAPVPLCCAIHSVKQRTGLFLVKTLRNVIGDADNDIRLDRTKTENYNGAMKMSAGDGKSHEQ